MNNRGFTLLEALVVVVLMATMLAVATPSLISWRESARVREVASDILSHLRQARSNAIATNQDIDVTIEPDTGQLLVDGTVVQTFPGAVPIETSPDGTDGSWVRNVDASTDFHSNGSTSSVVFIRVNNDDSLVVMIDSTASGLARL